MMNSCIRRIALVAWVALLTVIAGCAKEQLRSSPSSEPEPASRTGELDRIEVTGSRISNADMPSAPQDFTDPRDLASPAALERRVAAPPAPMMATTAERIVAEPDGGTVQGMYFEHYGVNPTIDALDEPVSTFSVDVDRASYSLVRSYLQGGRLPPEAAVRVEELVNAFDYDYPPPAEDSFQLFAEAFPSPHRTGYHLLHLGIKGREVAIADRKAANLVFVIDVSGSMAGDHRLGLVKRSLEKLIVQLRPDDTVGIVVFGSEARVALPPTPGDATATILVAIDQLETEGATNAAAGVRLGYEQFDHHFDPGMANRIILCSDGVANRGFSTEAESILELIGEENRRGIHLSTVGFGMGNYNDVLMERLAQLGGGNYYYVDSDREAERIFIDDFTGTLEAIAEDVKIQIEFDPYVVSRYRLLGFENRRLESEEFDDDTVDAGEVGAGHSVTALYEVKIEQPGVDLGWFRLRYKEPGENFSGLIETPLPAAVVHDSVAAASDTARLSLAVSMLAEKLRGSYWARTVDYAQISDVLSGLSAAKRQTDQLAELTQLVNTAQRIDHREDRFAALPATTDYDRVPELP